MPVEQWLPPVLTVAGLLFSGGGIAAIYGVYVTRKLGIKTNQTEANRDLNSTWDAIVENLQAQLNAQGGDIKELKAKTEDLEERLGVKERLVLKAIAHINKLEALVAKLGGDIPPRPEGLE